MTYTNQHTKATPSKWVGGYVVGIEITEGGIRLPIWSDRHCLMLDSHFDAVLCVSLALDKMTK